MKYLVKYYTDLGRALSLPDGQGSRDFLDGYLLRNYASILVVFVSLGAIRELVQGTDLAMESLTYRLTICLPVAVTGALILTYAKKKYHIYGYIFSVLLTQIAAVPIMVRALEMQRPEVVFLFLLFLFFIIGLVFVRPILGLLSLATMVGILVYLQQFMPPSMHAPVKVFALYLIIFNILIYRTFALFAERVKQERQRGDETYSELKTSFAQSKASEMAKSQFLAMSGHELKTPLNVIIGFSELIDDSSELPPLVKGYNREITENARHLLSLVGSIIDVAHTEITGLDLKTEWVRLGELTDFANQQLIALSRRKGLKVHSSVEMEFRYAAVNVDPIRIKQVMTNLIGNAVKFTEDGGYVLLFWTKQNNGFVFSISDSGCGIATEKQETIFKPFTQASASYDRSHGGIGLGLTIVKQIVDAHGGAVTLSSVPGEGTTISVYVPDRLVDLETRVTSGTHLPQVTTTRQQGERQVG